METSSHTERSRVADVERVRRLIGSNPESNAMVLRFVAHQYGVKSLDDLPTKVIQAICKRPAAFARAVKQYCESELLVLAKDEQG